MGWKAFALFATDQPRGFFGEPHTHQPDRLDEVLLKLGLTDYKVVGPSTLDDALYPPSGTLFLGAYAGGLALCHEELPVYFFPEDAQERTSGRMRRVERMKAALLDLYPESDVLAIVLHSVVDLWVTVCIRAEVSFAVPAVPPTTAFSPTSAHRYPKNCRSFSRVRSKKPVAKSSSSK